MKLGYRICTTLIALAALALGGCGKDNPTAFVASAKSYLAKNEYEAGIIQLKSAL
jgi:hypothetical protein